MTSGAGKGHEAGLTAGHGGHGLESVHCGSFEIVEMTSARAVPLCGDHDHAVRCASYNCSAATRRGRRRGDQHTSWAPVASVALGSVTRVASL